MRGELRQYPPDVARYARLHQKWDRHVVSGYLRTMTTSYGHDQDAEPPTPDDQQPDLVEPDSEEEPGSDPDPDPGKSADQAGIDS
jgi:hypothetical protein